MAFALFPRRRLGRVSYRASSAGVVGRLVMPGAAYRNRTDDNLITSEVLYRLS